MIFLCSNSSPSALAWSSSFLKAGLALIHRAHWVSLDEKPHSMAMRSIGIPYRAASIALFFVSGDKSILVPLSLFARSLGLPSDIPCPTPEPFARLTTKFFFAPTFAIPPDSIFQFPCILSLTCLVNRRIFSLRSNCRSL